MTAPHLTLFSHERGPNGWKVAFVLNALGLEYETKFLNLHANEQKAPEYTKYNPNGRVPCIIDHQNNDFVLWESGAIILYLISEYDKEHKFSYEDPERTSEVLQWMFFQGTGQGIMYGQAWHFTLMAPERNPYAITRYTSEVSRVCSVLNGVLATKPSGWLVGDKVTVADLCFVSWQEHAYKLLPEGEDGKIKFPNLTKWYEKMVALPYVKAALDEKAAMIVAHQ